MTRRPTPAPIPVPGLWVAALLLGSLFGATSALVPMIKLNALVLVAALVMLVLLAAGLVRGLLVNLIAAMIAGILAVVAMWAVWFGLQHGWPQLWRLIQQGPAAIEATIRHLASTTSYRVTTGAGTVTHDPSEVRLIWWIETLALLVAPVLGALASPRVKRRRAAASA